MRGIFERVSAVTLFSGRWSERLAEVTTLVLVVLLALALARLTWLLVPMPRQSFAPPPMAVPTTEKTSAAANPLEALAGMPLFGRVAPAHQVAAVAPSVPAPETNLNLILKGVIASDDKSQAWAFIAARDGHEQRYGIEALLPGRVRLSDIREDRVILQRNGRYETLYLTKDAASGTKTAIRLPAAGAIGKSSSGRRAKRSL